MCRLRQISFILLCGLFITAITQASLLSNGGFENGTWTDESSVPEGWWKWENGGWGSWKNNAGDAHSGSKFICLGGNNSSQYADFGQDVFSIKAGTVYEFEAWVKTESWGSPTARLKVEFKNSSNQVIRTDELILFTGQQSSWQKYTLTTDPAPEGTVRANFICEGTGEGSVFFDDTSVELIPVTDDPGLLNNTGFEEGVWNFELDMPEGWWKWANGGWGSWKNDYSKAHNGNKFVCLGGNEPNQYADFGQDIFDIKVGLSYKLNAWVKTESWGSPTAKLKVEFKNSGNEVIRTDELILFTSQQSNWQNYTLTTAPAPAGAVRANFICEGIGQGSVWFDDIYAIPAPVTDGPDILVNNSFEEGAWTAETDTPSDWWKWSGNWGWAGWENDADYAPSGSKFISMGGNDYTEYAVFGQNVNGIAAGKTYVFSTWVRAESMWWGWPTAMLKVEFKNSSDEVLRTDELNLFSGRNINWNWYNLVTAPAPAGTTKADFICYAEGEATMWFDDVKATLYVAEIAKNPSPRNEETNVDKDSILSWVAGDYAVSHNVYFGTDFNDVNDANTLSDAYKGNQLFGDDTYDPNMLLELGQTYYWRIDEVNDSNAASPWKGDVWNFTVTNLDVVKIDDSDNYQTMDGFGASFTESSAYLMTTGMTSTQYLAAMDALFDCNDGIGLSYLRQPMGTSDFRISNDYTYDDMPSGQTDYNLSHFSISYDEDYVIPILQDALAINPNISILSSPWSAPAWMKDSNALNYGSLIDSNEIYETYADYFVKYVQAYDACNITIDAVTLQNEPGAVIYTYPGMEMTSGELAKLVKILGPKFEVNEIDTKIVTYDWNWNDTDYPIEVLDDNEANPWIAGTAFHAYEGTYQKQSVVKNAYPDKDIYFTEYTATLDGDFEEDLMRLTSDFIIGSVRNWSRCIVLWNMALDETGGPKIDGGCGNCRGVITVDSGTGEITKNAEYYVLGHASKFVTPGAVRIGSSEPAEKVSSVAFKNTDNSIVVVVLNANKNSRDFKMEWKFGHSLLYILPGRSITTFVWQDEDYPNVEVWITTGDKSKLLEKQADSAFHGSSIKVWGGSAMIQGQDENIPDGTDFIAVTAGYYHSVALRKDGSLVAWGANNDGQCNVPAGNDFVAVSAGYWHNVALKSDGSLAAWGKNNDGQCNVPSGNDYAAVSAGGYHSIALKNDGTIAAWGKNEDGQCDVPSGSDFVAVSAGISHNVAIKSDGSIVAWGSNSFGEGDVPGGNDYVAVSAGEWFNIALKSEGSLAAWGTNYMGQCNVPSGTNYIAISANTGAFHSIALKNDGSIAAWGSGAPPVPEGNNFIAISGGCTHCVGIRAPGVSEGLLVYFPFDEDGQGTVADESGSGNDGTNVNTPTYTSQGKFGGAYDFDPYDYVTLNGNPTAGLENFAVSLWFKTAVPTNNYKLASAAWWSYDGGSRPGSGWILSTHCPEAWSQNNNSIPTESGNRSVSIIANEWNHMVVSYDGIRFKEYINGQIARDFATTGEALGDANGRNLEVGAWSQYYRNYDGLIDEFRVYDRALSECEVMTLYEGTW